MYGGLSVLGLRSAEAPFTWFLIWFDPSTREGRGFESCRSHFGCGPFTLSGVPCWSREDAAT